MSPENEAMKLVNSAISACLTAGIKISAGKLYPNKQIILAFPQEVTHDQENGVLYYNGVTGGDAKGVS